MTPLQRSGLCRGLVTASSASKAGLFRFNRKLLRSAGVLRSGAGPKNAAAPVIQAAARLEMIEKRLGYLSWASQTLL